MEASIEKLENELTPLRAFILPGGTTAASHIHLSRAICRTAERNIVRPYHSELINPLVLVAVNRLSDLLFVMGRVLNARSGENDTLWDKKRW
ncbi:MAG: cob(I)alamin adenosyltransferase [Acidobacteriaceae bacterium]|nr:cob(I)alamin adenosyltransferase [Acidobacteriaceae bacterium]